MCSRSNPPSAVKGKEGKDIGSNPPSAVKGKEGWQSTGFDSG